MSRLRAFLAVNFPIAVTRRIGEEMSAVRTDIAAAGWRVAWVPQPNLHVTVKFLGMVESAAVEALQGRLLTELMPRAPFELSAAGLGAFPDLDEARVLWAGVRPSEELLSLQRLVETACDDLGFQREDKPFRPHVTIGRVKDPGTPGSLPPIFAGRATTTYGSGRVQELVIYESRATRAGQEYKALARLPLGAGARLA